MFKRSRQAIGILSCVFFGMAILIASLIFSKVDYNTLRGSSLTEFGNEWEVNVGNNSFYDVKLPTFLQHVTLGETLVMKKKLPNDIDGHTYIFFRASHQKVRVYIEDKLTYSFGWNENRLFSKSPACAWVLVPLSQKHANETVQIELTGAYQNDSNRINNVYIGDKSAVFDSIIYERIGSILICFILIIVGIGMVIITIILRKSKITASLQRLGMLTFLIGAWSICVTNTLQIVYGDVYFLLNLEFFLFNLLLPAFFWFLLSFSHYNEKPWINLVFWISIVQFFVIELLQLLGVADYLETIIITHTIMGLGIGYIVLSGIWDMIHRQASREVKILIFSVIVLLIFIGMDIVRFYFMVNKDEGFYTRIGALLFIVLWGTEVIQGMSKRYVYMARTKALETLAYEDLMTGLKNRTAFEEWMNSYKRNSKRDDVYLVTFDMNGLKKINDNFGHMKGDQAIVILAKIIKSTFQSMGVTYRIGGDEISVIIPKANETKIEELADKLKMIEEKVSDASKELKVDFSVAVGYAKVSSKESKDIFEAYKEADYRMYVKKQEMKQMLEE